MVCEKENPSRFVSLSGAERRINNTHIFLETSLFTLITMEGPVKTFTDPLRTLHTVDCTKYMMFTLL